MALRISSELHRLLLREAAASPGTEVCGLLVGDKSVVRAVPAANIATEPGDTFEIDPATLFSAIRAERAGQGKLVGYYHSHPVGPPTPSARDTARAVCDGRFWLIIGERRVTAWIMKEDHQFEQVALQIHD
jgi:desampylase